MPPSVFAYTTTGTGGGTLFQGGSFFLDDDPDAGTANSRRSPSRAPTRPAPRRSPRPCRSPAGRSRNLVCSTGRRRRPSPPASPASPWLPGEAVTCTYTNTKRRHDHGHQGRRARRSPGLRLHDDRHRRRDAFASGSFLLDDDADGTLPASRTFTFTAPTRPAPRRSPRPCLTGWTLTNLVCTGGGANTTTTLATGLASIGLDPGEAVTCTYTNTKRGHDHRRPRTPLPAMTRSTFAFVTTGTGGGTRPTRPLHASTTTPRHAPATTSTFTFTAPTRPAPRRSPRPCPPAGPSRASSASTQRRHDDDPRHRPRQHRAGGPARR